MAPPMKHRMCLEKGKGCMLHPVLLGLGADDNPAAPCPSLLAWLG